MMKDFAAIDFETANNEPSSVCAVGIVVVRDCQIVDSYYSLIRPEPEYYNFFCTRVHGLTEEDTRHARPFPDVWAEVSPLLTGASPNETLPMVAHNKAFDENCLRAAFDCYGMDYPRYQFLCTLAKSRRVWPDGRHSLDVIAARCGYDLQRHHHALADAEACAAIAIKLFNTHDDPYFMETSDVVATYLRQHDAPATAAELAQQTHRRHEEVARALRQLRATGIVSMPRRGYYQTASK